MLVPSTIHAWRSSALSTTKTFASSPLASYVIPHQRTRPFTTSAPAMSGTQGIIAEAFSSSVNPPTNTAKFPDDYSQKPHHVKSGRGGFQNPWDSWHDLGVAGILKGVLQHRSKYGFGGPATHPAPNVVTPVFPPTRSTSSTELRATWLGHACYYVEFPGGLRVLFDPVFSNRCSPSQFIGPKRYTKRPCDIEEVPEIDVVCISHNHYDHTDHGTIMKIHKKWPNCQYFVPLGNKEWFTNCGIQNCTELDWWDEREIVLNVKEGKITGKLGLLPCQHTSGRGLTDRSLTLWGSWDVESGGKRVYFAGDTGYRAVPQESDGKDDYGQEYSNLPVCPAFKEIGENRGGFDLGLIPIGAYCPRWQLSSPMHADPRDAVNIFIDTRCKKALGMHWGTWVLTDEPVMEPPQRLKEALRERGIAEEGVFDAIDIGASRSF
ncbi:Metallo-hydrolase/oxidoreductase [Wilcoxina mikolae CBS 423.85]|nr:Metallo-hydrolase/oxidoreductase [Wilcoxina mikolae CBS 423.85]